MFKLKKEFKKTFQIRKRLINVRNNKERINEYLNKYNETKLYYDSDDMNSIKEKWQPTLEQKHKKDNKYIINRLLDNDFSMHFNLNCPDLDQHLVRNPTVYSEFSSIKNILFKISPRINKIREGDLANKATCLFKSNYNIIESSIKKIYMRLTANDNYIPPPCKDPNKAIHLSDQDLSFFSNELNIINRHIDIFSKDFNIDKDNMKIIDDINNVNIFTKSTDDLYDKLLGVVNENKDINYVSFYSLLCNMKFYLNVIETAINIRIKERIRRHNNNEWGWNSYQAIYGVFLKKLV